MSRAQLAAGAPIALAVSRFRFAKLRRVRPRPYALSELQPEMPRILWSEGYGQGLTEIVLAYGHPHDVSKPLIQVQTCFSDEDCSSPSLEEAIARAEHRNACFARLEWVEAGDSFDPFPELPVPDWNLDRKERILAVDGQERTGTVVSHGDYAALRFRQGRSLSRRWPGWASRRFCPSPSLTIWNLTSPDTGASCSDSSGCYPRLPAGA